MTEAAGKQERIDQPIPVCREEAGHSSRSLTSTPSYFYSDLDNVLLSAPTEKDNTTDENGRHLVSDSVETRDKDAAALDSNNNIENRVETLHEKVKMLRYELNLSNNKLDNANDMLKNCNDALAKSFTKSQIEHLTSGQRIRQWTEDDILSALSIRSLGLKSYRYIETTLIFHCQVFQL